MGLFGKKKKEDAVNEQERLDKDMRDDISKAYDELISGGAREAEEEKHEEEAPAFAGSMEAELIKSKIKTFKEKKTNEALADVFKIISGKKFFIPSVSNMKNPVEVKDGEIKIKPGATFSPALLTANKTTYLPIFTDEKSIVQKSPSGVNIQYTFEQCVGIVYNKKNPVKAIVINPFTENFTISEELLKAVFKQIDKNNG